MNERQLEVLVGRVEQLTKHIFFCGDHSIFVSAINPNAYSCTCDKFASLLETLEDQSIPQILLDDDENNKLHCHHIEAVIEWGERR